MFSRCYLLAPCIIINSHSSLWTQGTLLNSKSLISEANANALREASSRGIKVVIATGKVRKMEFCIYISK